MSDRKQRKIKKSSIQFPTAKAGRFNAWVTSSELDDVIMLSVLFNCSKQNVIREGVKQLVENTIGIITREKL